MAGSESKELINQLYAITSAVEKLRSRPVPMSGGGMMNKSGLKLMDAIVDNPGLNMGGISAILGITKGAVSQMTIKLEEQGILERIPSSGRDVYLKLSRKGSRLYTKHIKSMDGVNDQLRETLAGCSPEELETISSFLSKVNGLMDSAVNEKK